MRTGPPEDKALKDRYEDKSSSELQEEARRLGIPGWSGMTRSQLVRKIREKDEQTVASR